MLRMIDRKKNIFKLSQGEYIAVEKLEQVFKKCALVEELWVYGNSLESLLVAVVVPKSKQLLEWAAGSGVSGGWRGLGRSSVLLCGVVPVLGCCSGSAALCAVMKHRGGSWLLLLLVQPEGHVCTACVYRMCTPGGQEGQDDLQCTAEAYQAACAAMCTTCD